jgi:arylsulfatase A-like enzyme
MGEWKGVRNGMQKGNTKMELYNLATDEEEQHNVAAQHPEIVAKMLEIMQQEHQYNPNFPIRALDAAKIKKKKLKK